MLHIDSMFEKLALEKINEDLSLASHHDRPHLSMHPAFISGVLGLIWDLG